MFVSLETGVEEGDVIGKFLYLEGFFLGLPACLEELLFCLEELLVFLFVHCEVFVGVGFYAFLLVVQHLLFHVHEFGYCIRFEVIQQMF